MREVTRMREKFSCRRSFAPGRLFPGEATIDTAKTWITAGSQ